MRKKGNAQERVLKLENPAKEKVKLWKEFSKVKLTLADGNTLKGKLRFADDSTIYIYSAQVPINDITRIRKYYTNFEAIGWVLIASEAMFIFMDILFLPFFGGLGVFTVGGIPFVAAGILIKVMHINHKRSKGWEYSIIY